MSELSPGNRPLPQSSTSQTLKDIERLPKSIKGRILASIAASFIFGKGIVNYDNVFGHRVCSLAIPALLDEETQPPLPVELRSDIIKYRDAQDLSHNKYDHSFGLLMLRAVHEQPAPDSLVQMMAERGAV